jgi:hypothetical protein
MVRGQVALAPAAPGLVALGPVTPGREALGRPERVPGPPGRVAPGPVTPGREALGRPERVPGLPGREARGLGMHEPGVSDLASLGLPASGQATRRSAVATGGRAAGPERPVHQGVRPAQAGGAPRAGQRARPMADADARKTVLTRGHPSAALAAALRVRAVPGLPHQTAVPRATPLTPSARRARTVARQVTRAAVVPLDAAPRVTTRHGRATGVVQARREAPARSGGSPRAGKLHVRVTARRTAVRARSVLPHVPDPAIVPIGSRARAARVPAGQPTAVRKGGRGGATARDLAQARGSTAMSQRAATTAICGLTSRMRSLPIS